ncbi:MAG: hypothetical protein ABIS50_11355 [Luteolibacter sp.]|uniref:hypothetical protein n=1 Tax=Luteolibacter sp. TaxID=1962973 RepID=UPI003263AB62
MKHAATAIMLYRLAAALGSLIDFCSPGVASILRPFIKPLNTLADWHQEQSKDLTTP